MSDTLKSRTGTSHRLLRDLLECAPMPAYIIEVDTFNVIFSNERFKALVKKEQCTGMKCYQLLYPDSEPCTNCHIEKYKLNKDITSDVAETYHLESKKWLTIHSTIIEQPHGPSLCMAFFEARTERISYSSKRKGLTYIDELTGLVSNRGYELEGPAMLAMAIDAHLQMVVVAMKIEGLRQVNTMYGSAVGDCVLQKVVHAVLGLLPQFSLFARRRGNEFSFMFSLEPSYSKEYIYNILKTIENAIIKIARNFKQAAPCHLILGGCIRHGHATFGDLDYMAWEACAQALASTSRSPVLYDSTQFAYQQEVRLLQKDLARALSCGEMELFFQPKYNARTFAIEGAEALIRWNHPQRGRIGPGVFISMAEASGLISTIDEWVIEKSCALFRELADQGYAMVPLSINISPQTFFQSDLIETLTTAHRKYRVNPEWIELELTESTALKDMEMAKEIMYRLRKKGVRLSMDDFGTGYSSLSYLCLLPFDTIKIDRSFLTNTNEKSQKMFPSIISLLKAHDVHVIVEGVETEEQFRFVQDAGCHSIQGYYFSKPVPVEQFKEMLLQYVPCL